MTSSSEQSAIVVFTSSLHLYRLDTLTCLLHSIGTNVWVTPTLNSGLMLLKYTLMDTCSLSALPTSLVKSVRKLTPRKFHPAVKKSIPNVRGISSIQISLVRFLLLP